LEPSLEPENSSSGAGLRADRTRRGESRPERVAERPTRTPGGTGRPERCGRGAGRLERDVVVRGRAGARRGAGGLEVPLVDRHVGARREPAAAVAAAVLAAAQELDASRRSRRSGACCRPAPPTRATRGGRRGRRAALGEEARRSSRPARPRPSRRRSWACPPTPRGLVLCGACWTRSAASTRTCRSRWSAARGLG
jgi:hypothetical protein